MVLCVSDDNGKSFRSCATVVEHPDKSCRIYDPCLWFDPHGTLWMSYTQARGFNDGRSGVWIVTCKDADADPLVWSAPRRIANGIMMNKPIVTQDNTWLFPCAIWRDESGSVPAERHGLRMSSSPTYMHPQTKAKLSCCADTPTFPCAALMST